MMIISSHDPDIRSLFRLHTFHILGNYEDASFSNPFNLKVATDRLGAVRKSDTYAIYVKMLLFRSCRERP